MTPYDPSENIYRIKLDANESFFELPLELKDEISTGIMSVDFNRYPDPLQIELKKELAKIKGVGIEQIFLGNGSDEAIDLSALGASQSQGGTVSENRPGYVPVYFTFTNGGNILPGTPAEVFLLGEVRENVISVPVSALSEQQGRFFVFRRLDDQCYEKVPVTLGANDGTRVEIKDGIKAGDNIVTKGTVSVRLAESSGVVPEGHSHNH